MQPKRPGLLESWTVTKSLPKAAIKAVGKIKKYTFVSKEVYFSVVMSNVKIWKKFLADQGVNGSRRNLDFISSTNSNRIYR